MKVVKKMLEVLLKILIPLLLLLQCRDVEGSCKAISAQDIDDAAQLSKLSYWDLKKGQSVPYVKYDVESRKDRVTHTSSYVVDDVITATLDNQEVKVVIASKQSPKTTIISYRGTTNPAQLADQFKSGIVEKWQTLPFPGNMKVMKYTWEALNKLNVLNKMTFNSGTRYIITGHSLGGAMATLLAVQLRFHDTTFWSRDNSLITFASPRVGNGQFANEHDRLISPRKKLRIVYSRDAVPQLPPLIFGYQHVSTEIFITVKTNRKTRWYRCGHRNWFWCSETRWIPYDYSWEVCPLQHGLFTCSKKWGIAGTFIGYLVTDHEMGLYLSAANFLESNAGRANEFYSHQCSN